MKQLFLLFIFLNSYCLAEETTLHASIVNDALQTENKTVCEISTTDFIYFDSSSKSYSHFPEACIKKATLEDPNIKKWIK